MEVKHGRICFLTDRGPVLGTSAAVVVVLVPVVPSMVVATAIIVVVAVVVSRDRRILSRGGGGRKAKVQEFVCILLRLTAFRVATHNEFQNLLPCECLYIVDADFAAIPIPIAKDLYDANRTFASAITV